MAIKVLKTPLNKLGNDLKVIQICIWHRLRLVLFMKTDGL